MQSYMTLKYIVDYAVKNEILDMANEYVIFNILSVI